jgi:hypothetical protein
MTEKTLLTTGTFLTADQIEDFTQAAEQEFPEDPALQEIYIARQIMRLESEELGMDYFSYLKQLADKILEEQPQGIRWKCLNATV